ncbi:hypothetical protein D917_06099 [Trichinella nativa]|uniref:Uncharacterized protein n=1 Tax=Trichinella nativa TaxID=6335 RepID=A0A1Y3ETM3_9BILA|nr:hypothetical protein D917_06099 [Trichinella nativa]
MTDLLLEGESDIFDHPDFASYATCMQRCCARLNGAAVPPLKEEEKRRGPSKLPLLIKKQLKDVMKQCARVIERNMKIW